jgi:hypothetical protein
MLSLIFEARHFQLKIFRVICTVQLQGLCGRGYARVVKGQVKSCSVVLRCGVNGHDFEIPV